MSLLADLLSKVKSTGGKRDVPPDLREVVAKSVRSAAFRKKIIVLSLAALLAVGSGFGAVYLLEIYVKSTVKPPVEPKDGQKTAVRSTATVPPPPGKEYSPISSPVPASAFSAASPPSPAPSPAPRAEKSTKPEPGAGKGTPAGKSLSPKKSLKERPENVISTRQDIVRKSAPRKEREAVAPEATPVPTRQQPSREELAGRDVSLYSARTCEARGDYQQALAHYRKALEIDPESYLVMNNIASVLIRLGSYEESMQYSRRALAARQNYVPSLVNLGVASIRLDNMTEGESYLSKALSIEPSHRHALLNLALLHEKTKEYDKASRSFLRLSEMGDMQGHLGRARIAEKRGQRAEAVRFYREILALNDLDTKTRKMINERLQVLGDGS